MAPFQSPQDNCSVLLCRKLTDNYFAWSERGVCVCWMYSPGPLWVGLTLYYMLCLGIYSTFSSCNQHPGRWSLCDRNHTFGFCPKNRLLGWTKDSWWWSTLFYKAWLVRFSWVYPCQEKAIYLLRRLSKASMLLSPIAVHSIYTYIFQIFWNN